jgi:hypothetical protein
VGYRLKNIVGKKYFTNKDMLAGYRRLHGNLATDEELKIVEKKIGCSL